MEEDLNPTDQAVSPQTVVAPVPVETSTLPETKPPFGSWWKVGILVVGVLLAGSITYTGYQYSQKQTPSTPQPTPTSIMITTPTPGTQYPTVTGKSPSITPVKTTTNKVLSYQLPAGWQTAKNQNQDFEVGFNPQTMRINPIASSTQVWIEVQRPQPLQGYATYAIVSLRPYDGGSRHNFIYKQLGYTAQTALSERMPYYNEVSYTYNNWPCLILFGLAFSAQGTTWGMCPVNSTQALFIQGPNTQLETEEFIKTIKWLK